ncbi:MAG: ABC transporter ATP-binding protein [Methanoregula sp.]|jgi:ABC-2 type transport system ATP-binding protein|nr:ABC transporter ATP-binding protein [Methanoregula sp.]
MIQFDHLSKEYDGILAVNNLTTEIETGEIFGLLGPNGSGKSTTILMLIGLIEPSGGRCLIDGVEVAKNPIKVKQHIGYMPEDVGFYPILSAEENLTYFAKLFRMESREYTKRIPDLLSLVGLDGVTKQVGGYSKGMRQRLGLANALLNDPSVIILDEPTANLDPQGVADYRRIISGVTEEGKTVFVSSHILSEVSRVCTSIGLLSKGRLIAQGKWEDLSRQLRVGDDVGITITVETRDPVPEFTHTDLVSVTYSEDRKTATLVAHTDISDFVIDACAQAGVRLHGIRREGASLEDLFLSCYQTAGVPQNV